MKASTLFGMTLALIVGLIVLVGAKYAGYFEPTIREEKKKEKGPMVLVAARNLIRGTAALPGDGKIRPLLESELEFYEKNRTKLMVPVASAVEFRVLAKNVPAGHPLFEEHFEAQSLPEPVSARLESGMRTVHLQLAPEHAAGGLLRVGERVDVLLTTEVSTNPDPSRETQPIAPFTATSVIARNLKIVIKRDNLLTVMQAVPKDKPLSFILEANPYRAALIEYAKGKGVLTISPCAAMMFATSDRPGASTEAESREYRDEDRRVQEFLNNESIITGADLERIFNLKTRPAPVAPEPAPSIKVELISGTKHVRTMVVQDGEVTYVAPSKPSAIPARRENVDSVSHSAFTFGPPAERAPLKAPANKDRKPKSPSR